MTIRFAAALLLLAAPAAAQDILFNSAPVATCLAGTPSGDTSPDCIGAASNACQDATPDGATTIGITACIARETEIWDGFLNATYRDLRADLDAADAESGAPGDFLDRSDALGDAQRAWIAFRDADCSLAYARWQDGSIRSVVGASCKMGRTATRTIELRDMRDGMQGGG